ncbi:MAG TPA: methylenetetrahydrofolate reductase [Solirubrobacteraceae bacterium]|jgi:methylenetetrahydrofolate reductase (NADPH)|nr:methylenetetrahydrofolate reductase [Solirubrobacteraceae bacterium]
MSAIDVRYEVLPLGKSEEQAAQLPEPVRLTVTCSPKHGPDHSVAVGGRLQALGHTVTVHVAARMVRDRAHLDELLSAMRGAGIEDLFLIGGDADPPAGSFTSAVELLPVVAEHSERPRAIGIAGYPEGHPLIEPAALQQALADKSRYADYITTQLCFDPHTLRNWVTGLRERGIDLPVLIGMPGKVTPAKLLEMSARIGVGPSMSFVRKQSGVGKLLALLRRSAPDRLYDALAPELGDPGLAIAGLHYFTFNQLVATYEWHRDKHEQTAGPSPAAEPVARNYVRAEETRT